MNPQSGPAAGGCKLACEAMLRKRSALTHGARSRLLVCAVLRTRQDRVGRPANPPEACPGPWRSRPATGPAHRLRQVPAVCWNGLVRSVFLRKTDSTLIDFDILTEVSTKVDTYQPPSESVKWAVSECGVSRMDAAAELTGTYLQRPRSPTPPRHPTESPLLILLLRLPASGRHYRGCRLQARRTPNRARCRPG